MLVLQFFLSLLPFSFLPLLYSGASGFLPSAPCVLPLIFFLRWVYCSPLATHFRFPSRDFTRQGSLPDACDYLTHFLLINPPWAHLPSPSHTRTGYPPFASVLSPRSIFPSRNFPQQGSLLTACNSLPHFFFFLILRLIRRSCYIPRYVLRPL